MIKKMRKTIIPILSSIVLILISACSDMNELHDKYLKDGETIYIAKFDSMYLYPGRERVMMKYWLSDPKAKKCVIKWALGNDSIIKDIDVTPLDKPGYLFIENLNEGSVSFDIINRDKEFKFASVKDSYTLTVYGDNFQATLLNVSIKNLKYSSSKSELRYTWAGDYDNTIGYQLKYTDKMGTPIDTLLSVVNRNVVLKQFPSGGSFEYRTLYLPEPTAIDTFYTDYRKVVIP
jgi:hypothetical protein